MPLVKNHMELCNLRLVFGCSEQRVDLKLYYKKREELLSVIITLRRITKNYINEIRFILNDIDYLEKHYIVMPCDYALDEYETSILRKLSEVLSINSVYDPRIFQIFDEVMMNCKFTNTSKVEQNLLDRLVEFMPYVYQEMVIK